MPVYIPEKLKVGFQNRSGTYTGKLAYVIYFGPKGVLKKEKGWQSWRDRNIEPQEFDNSPTEGFVLNKKVGGYANDWGSFRQDMSTYPIRSVNSLNLAEAIEFCTRAAVQPTAYARVFDPRGFEFEITLPNLLYILQHTNSIKGKGLEGKFVYGWEGTELTLIPEGAPEFSSIQDFSEILNSRTSVKAKDLVTPLTPKRSFADPRYGF
jgi:hypothetical protein